MRKELIAQKMQVGIEALEAERKESWLPKSQSQLSKGQWQLQTDIFPT